jgi:hypothetical protein
MLLSAARSHRTAPGHPLHLAPALVCACSTRFSRFNLGVCDGRAQREEKIALRFRLVISRRLHASPAPLHDWCILSFMVIVNYNH